MLVDTTKFTLLVLAILYATNATAQTEQKTDPYIEMISDSNISVWLFIGADDSIENEVRSYLTRELRELGNIKLVDYPYEMSIDVRVLKTYSVSGISGPVNEYGSNSKRGSVNTRRAIIWATLPGRPLTMTLMGFISVLPL